VREEDGREIAEERGREELEKDREISVFEECK